ncbi:MAG: carbon storage regulator [Gammaproteobacteria bacterium]
MLILSRKPGTKVYIGKDRKIAIEVISVAGNHVRLGFIADSDVPIHREEVLERMEREEESVE